MFFNACHFPFVNELNANWKDVRQDFQRLLPEHFTPWPERQIYNGRWEVSPLFLYGKKQEEICSLCPMTTRLVESIPGMVTAGFSKLESKTHITAHRGYSNELLRCHLGLIVPRSCCLRVGDEERAWSEGDCLIFDDTAVHEAWNNSDSPRIVMLVDFKRALHSVGS